MEISLQRTRDFALVKSILTSPRIWPWIASDFHPAPEDFAPNESEAIHYMLAKEGDNVLGLYMAHWIICPLIWEIHHAILPSAWKHTDAIRKAVEAWLWRETPCRTAVGHTPENNKLACRYALRNGMREIGRIPNGYLKNGASYAIIVFGKERP